MADSGGPPANAASECGGFSMAVNLLGPGASKLHKHGILPVFRRIDVWYL
jgi:hypothetical protein